MIPIINQEEELRDKAIETGDELNERNKSLDEYIISGCRKLTDIEIINVENVKSATFLSSSFSEETKAKLRNMYGRLSF